MVDKPLRHNRVIAISLLVAVCSWAEASPVETDLQAFLSKLPNVKNLKSGDAKKFTFDYELPVDHENPGGPTFTMRAVLFYKSDSAPMVLNTTGYQLLPSAYSCELTSLLSANQLTLEHRYFGKSLPTPLDWQYLTVAQTAADFHHITQALKGFFKGKWLNTGISKGGMTSVYHRYFYPGDVDCTVAYVTPNSYSPADERYITFIENLGKPGTSQKLEAWQQGALNKRSEIVAIMEEKAKQKGLTFDYSGGAEMAFEWALLQTPFSLWQYGGQSSADSAPAPEASAKEHWAYMNKAMMGDALSLITSLPKSFKAYYFQGATEIGDAAYKESHLQGLKYPNTCLPKNVPPLDVKKAFNGETMKKIQEWIDEKAEKIIFIYGGTDPWTAGAFNVTPDAEKRGIKKYVRPKGNHYTQMLSLPKDMLADCRKHLSQFMGASFQWNDSSACVSASPIASQPMRMGYGN